MKSRRVYLLSGLAVGVLATLAIFFLITSMSPGGTRVKAGVVEAGALYKWISAWSNDHGGELPRLLEDLKSRDIGQPDDFDKYLERVIEYRGGGQKLTALDKDFVILRYRAGRNPELEARVYADGRANSLAPQ